MATPVTVVAAVRDERRTQIEPKRRRSRVLIPLIIPIVITAGAGTVVLIDQGALHSRAKGSGSSPSAPVSSGTNSGSTQAGSASASAVTTPSTPASAPAADPNAGQGTANQPGGGTVPNTGGGNAGGTGTGSGTGTGTSNNGGAAAAGGAAAIGGGTPGGGGGGSVPAPAPTRTTPTPDPPVPQGCGGDGWGYITGVGSGIRLGLASAGMAGGTAAVMGGYTAYGWARSAPDPGQWYTFSPCSLSKPVLVQNTDNKGVSLSTGFSFTTRWTVVSAASGNVTLREYMSSTCLTDNGSGKAVTMETCTPGNKFQEWKVPAAG